MSFEAAIGEREGVRRRKSVVAAEGLEWSRSRGWSGAAVDRESSVGKYWKGVAKERQECTGVLSV